MHQTITLPAFLNGTLNLGPQPSNAAKLYKAALDGDLEKVQSMLQAEPPLLEASVKEHDGSTVLHAAVAGGRLPVLKHLLDAYGAQQLTHPDDQGRTPIHWAARMAPSEILAMCLSLGGGLGVSALDIQGRPPLHYAARYGNEEQLEMLVMREPSTLNIKDKEGEHAFHAVARGGKVGCGRALLRVGAETARALMADGNVLGQLPSHLAAGYGHVALLQFLAIKAPAKVLALPDAKGKTCMHYACGGGHLPVVTYILAKAGRDAIGYKDEVGRIPLFYAAMEGHANVTEYLVTRAGAEQVRVEDQNGRTPIDMARDEPRGILLRVESWLRTEEDVMTAEKRLLQDLPNDGRPRRLSEASRALNRQQLFEELNLAIANGDRGVVAELVSTDPQLLSSKNAYGDIPLHTAAFKGDVDSCQLFVNRGGEDMLVYRNDDGETALHVAVSQDMIAVAEWMLIEAGPQLLKIQANDGQTALHYAVARNFTNMARLLVAHGGPDALDIQDKQRVTPRQMARSVDMRNALEEAVKDYNSRLVQSPHSDGGSQTPDAAAAAAAPQSLIERLKRNGSAGVLKLTGDLAKLGVPQQGRRASIPIV